MRSTKGVRIRKLILEGPSSSGSSAHLIASNDDLLLEILLCLPIKSLLKFKCVSKHWLSLISEPQFTHLKNLKPKSVLYLFCQAPMDWNHCAFVPLYPLHTRSQFLSLTFVGKNNVRVLQSCNGLLCCFSYDLKFRITYYIYNPTTKQFRTLPPPLRDMAASTWVNGITLAFDHSKSHVYKVVCICSRQSSDDCQILIYSSETRHWRVSGAPFPRPFSANFENGVYWNEAIHWVADTGDSRYFDLNEELVQEMPMPRRPDGSYGRIVHYFGESNGHLHFVESPTGHTRQFNVYEMERDHSGWFVKFQVDLNGVAPDLYDREYEDYICSFLVLSVVRGESEEDSFLVLHVPGNIIRYNVSGHTHQVICNTSSPRYNFSARAKEVIYYTDSSRYNLRSNTRHAIRDTYTPGIHGWRHAFQFIESLSHV